MNFIEKNNFVVQHASAKHFDKDRELFLKTFPASPLTMALMNANDHNKQQLDERMLLELLEHACTDCILENRGIITDHAPDMDVADAQHLILNSDIATIDRAVLLRVIKALGIDTPDKKTVTLIAALEDHQALIKMTPTGAGEGEGTGTGDAGTGDAGAGAAEGDAGAGDAANADNADTTDPDKKKEDHE